MSKYMEVSAVAARLSVSTMTVYRLGETGELALVRMGRSKAIRVVRKSVEDFEKKRLLESVFESPAVES